MEDEMAKLRLVDEEDDPVHDREEEDKIEEDFLLCLVGKPLPTSQYTFHLYETCLRKLDKNEDLVQVLLFNTKFWVQIHNLLSGCMSKGMARQLGNFIGELGHREKLLSFTTFPRGTRGGIWVGYLFTSPAKKGRTDTK
ncbi:hypothetical protein J1N35_029448 [Gossypium stocksii]|uniref:Uncharacterized protein n=1 Tax=Gossypium stocksii TaxID=47602 RepID=A0A9D3ZS25_9ROSI|nr:hypothetical protein J1N35_029448 [Gossypium stocksii]